MNMNLNIKGSKNSSKPGPSVYCDGKEEDLRKDPFCSPYPGHYEKKVATRTGLEVFMRPVKPEDAPLLLDLFNSLSPRTRYFRFFTPLKTLPRHLLVRYTQVDYKKDMALVAMDLTDPDNKILAVARFISKSDQADAEFAVVVRDEWQGKGVGRVLLENLILIAGERRIESMSGYVLSENIHMLSLARTLGFHLSRIPGEDQYFLKIDLRSKTINEIKGR